MGCAVGESEARWREPAKKHVRGKAAAEAAPRAKPAVESKRGNTQAERTGLWAHRTGHKERKGRNNAP